MTASSKFGPRDRYGSNVAVLGRFAGSGPATAQAAHTQ